ncbi:conserved hypothetical protein [Gammaproteobacteria bacterium]
MNSKKIAYFAIGLWAVTAIGVGTLLVRGHTKESTDGRRTVLVSAGERSMIFREMRGMLSSVQGILIAHVANDKAEVARVASLSGMGAAVDVSPALLFKLPLEFKELGFGTHRAFDTLAQAAKDEGTSNMTLVRLGELLGRCVACHAAYQFQIEGNSQTDHGSHAD